MESLDILSPLPRAVGQHATQPKNVGMLETFTGHGRITGPCGDTMNFWVRVEDNRVRQVSFTTTGCGPSFASGSMATCLAEGKTLSEVKGITQQVILAALGGLPPESEHCALLAANTLLLACRDHEARQGESRKAKHAPGTGCGTCNDSACPSKKKRDGESESDFQDRQALEARLCRIRHKIVVLSGKGGVGKSTVAVNLAMALALEGFRVGLLDTDIHGPSVPTMLGLEGFVVTGTETSLNPAVAVSGLKVMSLGFFLANQDDAVIWRGPMKNGLIRQFLKDVDWGDLDYLVVDSPPGTGDEPLSLCQMLGNVDGALIITTPQRVAAVDVRKSVTFCRQLGVPVLGLVENMSGMACPHCGEIIPVFPDGAGRAISSGMGVRLLAQIPFDPAVGRSGDSGQAIVTQDHHSRVSQAFHLLAGEVMSACNESPTASV